MIRAVTRVDAPETARSGCPACRQPSSREAFTKLGVTYRRCSTCDVLFASPLPAGFRESYQDPEYFESLGLRSSDPELSDAKSAIARARLSELTKVGAGGPLLEVGAATGAFLEAAEALEPVGIDVALEALKQARGRRLCADPEDLPFGDGAFASVAMYDTIEHLPDPRAALLEVARILRPGGLLHLSTPNQRGLAGRLMGRGFPHVNPEHVVLFGRRSLGRLLHETGFLVRTMTMVRKPLSLSYVAGRLRRHPVAGLTAIVAGAAGLLGPLARRPLPVPSGELSVLAVRAG